MEAKANILDDVLDFLFHVVLRNFLRSEPEFWIGCTLITLAVLYFAGRKIQKHLRNNRP